MIFVHLWYQYQAKWTAHNVTKKLSMSSQNSHSRMRYTHVDPKCRMTSKTNSKCNNMQCAKYKKHGLASHRAQCQPDYLQICMCDES